jgi:hypothetical protein
MLYLTLLATEAGHRVCKPLGLLEYQCDICVFWSDTCTAQVINLAVLSGVLCRKSLGRVQASAPPSPAIPREVQQDNFTSKSTGRVSEMNRPCANFAKSNRRQSCHLLGTTFFLYFFSP